jgi:hypothetical protein
MELAYRGFLKVRPPMQAVARALEGKERASDGTVKDLSRAMVRELRSDHAGETGAVFIYRGVLAVAKRRGDEELIVFATRHATTEAEHLRLIEGWLPPRQRSRLLGPWKLAGWLTGALPALAGRRALYATIAAVERLSMPTTSSRSRGCNAKADRLSCWNCCCAARPTSATTAMRPRRRPRSPTRQPAGGCAAGARSSARARRSR